MEARDLNSTIVLQNDLVIVISIFFKVLGPGYVA